MWIYTKAVLCDGPESTQEYLKHSFSKLSGNVVVGSVKDKKSKSQEAEIKKTSRAG